MILFFGLLSGFSLLYWLFLMLYTGFSAAQNWIWLLFAFVAGLNAAASVAWRRGISFVTLRRLSAVHTVAFAGLAVLFVSAILIASRLHPKDSGNPEFVVVLGAEVRADESLSKSLLRRLDRALDYSRNHPQTRFVMSGGKPSGLPRSEAEYMADYLVAQGMPAERLLLEVQSKNTYENLTYSRALIERVIRDGAGSGKAAKPRGDWPGNHSPVLSAEEKPLSVAVLSADYHLFRAQSLAKKAFGFSCGGVAARTDPLLFPHFFFRECLALLKDKFLGRL